MATPRQLYQAKLDAITRRYLAREDALAQTALDLLRQLQKEIAAQVAMAEGFEAYKLRELRANLEVQIATLEKQLTAALTSSLAQAYQDGGEAIVEPLQAIGYTSVFFTPSQAQIQTVSEFSADLIKGMTADLLTRINGQLRRAALGELSPFAIMQEITRILGFSGKMVTGGIAYRAEMITRTELARMYNLASYTTQLDAVNTVPGLLKRWVATGDRRTRQSHLRAHARYAEKPIPVKDAFEVGGESLRYPGDPAGSAKETINCRCRSVLVVPEIGVLSSPLDGHITNELERRKQEK